METRKRISKPSVAFRLISTENVPRTRPDFNQKSRSRRFYPTVFNCGCVSNPRASDYVVAMLDTQKPFHSNGLTITDAKARGVFNSLDLPSLDSYQHAPYVLHCVRSCGTGSCVDSQAHPPRKGLNSAKIRRPQGRIRLCNRGRRYRRVDGGRQAF